jgi:hypothetical protein
MRLFAAVFLLNAVSASAKPLGTCSRPGQCVVIPKSCCGQCGSATAEDSMAVNANTLEAQGRPECKGQSCPRCTEANDPARAHQLVAVCEERNCKVLDLSKMDETVCKADTECVAIPSQCCSPVYVAVRTDAGEKLQQRMCGSMVTCPANVRPAPPVRCRDHRCVVRGNNGLGP